MLDKYLIDEKSIEKNKVINEELVKRIKKILLVDHINSENYITPSQLCKFNKKYIGWTNTPEMFDPVGTITKTGYAYMYIPDYIGYYSENITKNIDLSNNFSFIMLNLINELSKKDPVGWIFDLRYNSGGIIHAFILGFSSILNNFTINCKNIDGNIKLRLVRDDHSLYYHREDENPETIGLLPPINKIPINNVHVLINNETASCGELLTYLLKKQHNAIIYGEPSFGLSTWMEYQDINTFNEVTDEISLRYPDLIFDFSDSDIKMVKIKKYRDTPVSSIRPDIENIPYDTFGMF